MQPSACRAACAQAALARRLGRLGAGLAALDAGDIAALLAPAARGETVQLTLCGERSAQTFDTHRASLLEPHFKPFQPHAPLDLLKQL